jgi:hypothetical protein
MVEEIRGQVPKRAGIRNQAQSAFGRKHRFILGCASAPNKAIRVGRLA